MRVFGAAGFLLGTAGLGGAVIRSIVDARNPYVFHSYRMDGPNAWLGLTNGEGMYATSLGLIVLGILAWVAFKPDPYRDYYGS